MRSETPSPNLSGFHHNHDLLKAAVAKTYLEAISNRSDSMYLAIENSSPSSIKNFLSSMMSTISEPSGIEKER